MNRKGKTVRKCYGCILNLGDHCAIYEDPHGKWHRSRCTSYNDKELYNKYLSNLEKHSSKEAKKRRREIAKHAHTEEHHQGMRTYG
jgi:hypothetical protein